MTNFPTILNRLTGMFSEDRADFIARFDEYDLLIIDDLGVERSTEYAMAQMFFVIDSRYRSRSPMIITTNLKLSELKNPPDLALSLIHISVLLFQGWEPVGFWTLFGVGIEEGLIMWVGALPCILLLSLIHI